MAKKGKKGNAEPVQQPDSDSDWDDGAKKPSKKQLEKEAKKQEQQDKKKERETLLEMEESSIKSKRGGKTKSHKKGSGLDDALNQFTPKGSINADGLDDSLAALTLLKKDAVTNKDIDRHPERRFKAALAAYTERRLPEMRKENPGLRKQQIEQLIYKEFQTSDENPFNKDTNIEFNATTEEVSDLKKNIRDKRSKKFEH